MKRTNSYLSGSSSNVAVNHNIYFVKKNGTRDFEDLGVKGV